MFLLLCPSPAPPKSFLCPRHCRLFAGIGRSLCMLQGAMGRRPKPFTIAELSNCEKRTLARFVALPMPRNLTLNHFAFAWANRDNIDGDRIGHLAVLRAYRVRCATSALEIS